MFSSKRRVMLLLALSCLATLIVGVFMPAAAQSPIVGDQMSDVTEDAYTMLMDVDGNNVGSVHFVQQGENVAVLVRVNNMEPGFHGVHVHSVGACDAMGEMPFSSAGPHWDTDSDSDEMAGDHPNHSGDLLPVLVLADGTGAYDFVTDRFTVAEMFDEDGTSVIVHAGVDNFNNTGEAMAMDEASVAGGNSGARAACGIVEQGDMVMNEGRTSAPMEGTMEPADMNMMATEEAPMMEPTMEMTPDMMPTVEPTMEMTPDMMPTVEPTESAG